MNPEKWRKLDEIFHNALEINTIERAGFLSKACENDPELKNELESLLISHGESEGFLKKDAFALGAQLFTEMNEPPEIGGYRIVREIGRGGFGTVFLAVREDEFSQKTALKIIKRGMDTDEIIRRFRTERQVLASLNHPFITRFLDGGTTPDGLPFLVMEYVEGTPLNEFCRTQRLSLEERLTLFRKICSAVAYAHQNLVVHRDLKPSNILITPIGEPKLLDFGIAKILSDDENATRAVTRIYTPEYASPEQQNGDRITTAADIYSLGIVLSELIRNPQSAIPNPSTSDNQPGRKTNASDEARYSTTGDLEKIIGMATRAEPVRRYASVGDLAEDIRRYQGGFPVAAQKDTLRYRAGKFIRRNKIGFASAAIVLLSMISGFSVAIWQARVAGVERAKAEQRFADVRQLTNSFLFEFHDAIKDTAGTYQAQRLVVTKALEYLNKLSSEAENNLPLLDELTEAYVRIGDVQKASLREHENALRSFQTAVEIDRRILRLKPNDAATWLHLAGHLFKCGETLNDLKRGPEVLEVYQESVAIFEDVSRLDPDNLRLLIDLAQQQERVGETLDGLDRAEEAKTFYRKALQTIEHRIALESELTTGLSFAWMNRGELLKQLKDFHGAAASYTKAAEIAEIAWQENPSDLQAMRNLSASHNRAGDTYDALGDFRRALEQFKFSWNLVKTQAAQNPTDYQIGTAESYYTVKVAVEMEKIGEKSEALKLVRTGLALREKLAAADNSRGITRFYEAELFEDGGDLLFKLNERPEARKTYEKALHIYSEIMPEEAQSNDLDERKTRLRKKIKAL